MAQGGSVLDLIWAACLGSDGQGGLGCWAAALSTGVRFRGGGFAGGGQNWHSGVGLGRGWAVEDAGGTCSPLGYLGRRCGAGRMALDGECDSGRRVLPERMAGVPGMRRKRGNLAQKERAGLGVLTEA